MQLALQHARRGEGCVEPNPMVGAVVASPDGRIISTGYHQRFGEAHAEINAIQAAGSATVGADLYVTLEPCPMCAGALVNARIRRLVYGCEDPKAGGVKTLFQIATDARLNHRVEVTSGVLGEESAAVLREFFQIQRRKGKK